MRKAICTIPGFPGRVPLPPLKGVRFVVRSNPLLKSKYSLKAFTLICAHKAPTNASTARGILTVPAVHTAVPSPNRTHAGVKIKKGSLIGPSRHFKFFIKLLYASLITRAVKIQEIP
jgi:hypothetical protein